MIIGLIFFILLVVSAAMSADDTVEAVQYCSVTPKVKSPACLFQRTMPQEKNAIQKGTVATEHHHDWATLRSMARQARTAMTATQVDCTKANCQWTKKWNCPGKPAGTEHLAVNDDTLDYECCCLNRLWQQSTATTTTAQVDCTDYLATSACLWTKTWNCPGQPAGTEQPAKNDHSLGYQCCCLQGMWQQATTTMVSTQVLHPDCPPELQCSCLYGQNVTYEKDDKGCIADCKCMGCPEPPLCFCPKDLGLRIAYDKAEDGCKTNCHCEDDPEACPPEMLCLCTAGQKILYEKDERGCKTSCNCTGCPDPPLCGCPGHLGLKTVYDMDVNGCRTRCHCKQATATMTTTQVLPLDCPPAKKCACLLGQHLTIEKDAKGCIDDCKCVGCPEPPLCRCLKDMGLRAKYDMDENGCKRHCHCEDDPKVCPRMMACRCRAGQKIVYEKDGRGCPTSCNCAGCPDPPLCGCAIHLGLKTIYDMDANGCRTRCHCKEDPNACPPQMGCDCLPDQQVVFEKDERGCTIGCSCAG